MLFSNVYLSFSLLLLLHLLLPLLHGSHGFPFFNSLGVRCLICFWSESRLGSMPVFAWTGSEYMLHGGMSDKFVPFLRMPWTVPGAREGPAGVVAMSMLTNIIESDEAVLSSTYRCCRM